MKSNTLNILVLAGVFFLFNSQIMAQSKKKYKEINITKESDIINVSADSLWNIIKQFDNVGVFFSGIDHAEGKGKPEFKGATCNERTCYVNLKGYSEIHEKLTQFNEEKKEFAYELIRGAPAFMVFAGNHWSIKEISPNQCTLKMDATIRMKRFMGFLFGGKMKRTIEKQLPETLQELKLYAETGEVSEAKKERMSELKKKNISYQLP